MERFTNNGLRITIYNTPMSKLPVPDDPRQLPQAIVTQMLTLATSGLGLVAALAWNEFVKALIDEYVKPFVPQGSHVISLALYAAIVTALAVMVTLQLTKLQQTIERAKPSLGKSP